MAPPIRIESPFSSNRSITLILSDTGDYRVTITQSYRLYHALREVFEVGNYLKTFAEQFCQIEKIAPSVIALELAVEADVSFDHSHLNQVMWNLCRNALRHSRRQDGSIRIAVDVMNDGSVVKLDVVDDGPGVSASLARPGHGAGHLTTSRGRRRCRAGGSGFRA